MPIYSELVRRGEASGLDRFVFLDINDTWQLHDAMAESMRRKKPGFFAAELYPNCIPPWPLTWMECRDGDLDLAMECMVPEREELTAYVDEIRPHGAERACYFGKSLDDVRIGVRIRTLCWLRDLPSRQIKLAMENVVLLDDVGTVILEAYVPDAGVRAPISVAIENAMFAFSIANCKNIVADERIATVPTTYAGRIKALKTWKYKYHVLKISGSFTGAHESKGGSAEKAMHICRGHFARYTDDAPLFGKYTGLFWRPMHVRGNVKHGIVDKDYELKV